MARIPTISRLIVEDFKDQKSWIGKLVGPLNSFMQALSFAMNGGLTFEDNITSQTQLLDFIYNGSSSLPIKFAVSRFSTIPLACTIISATENLNTPVALVLAWQYTQQNQVAITDVTKLTLGTPSTLTTGARYQIRVRVTP